MHEKLKSSIAELRAHTVAPLVGIREIYYGYDEFPHAPNYLTRDDVRQGLRILEREGVPYDFFVMGGWKSFPLQFVPDLAEQFPELKINVHHIACPEISKSEEHDLFYTKHVFFWMRLRELCPQAWQQPLIDKYDLPFISPMQGSPASRRGRTPCRPPPSTPTCTARFPTSSPWTTAGRRPTRGR